MIKKFYYVIYLALLFLALDSTAESLRTVSSERIVRALAEKESSSYNGPKGMATLATPQFTWGDPAMETSISMYVSNPNAGTTEIYRSTSETSGFTLIHTQPASQSRFTESGLKPRTTYYYKARAVNGSDVSAFSDPYPMTTWSNAYPPEFSARAINENTIELTLKDRSYNDSYYTIRSTAPDNSFSQDVQFETDSGGTLTITHNPVNPGTTYTYSVDFNGLYDQPSYYNYARTSATTPGSASCAGIGSIEREIWNNVPGYPVSSIPVTANPNKVQELNKFETFYNDGDNYGARVRGYVCIPQNGNYTFWISSDDNAELYLSTDETPANKKLIASSKWTLVNEWNKYPTQQSAPISLVGGRRYYIEALHKEATGDDHLAVGWKLPDGSLERPIPGIRLIKFERANYNPTIKFITPTSGQTFTAPATVRITSEANDPEGPIQFVDYYSGGTRIGQAYDPPFTYEWKNVAAGNYTIEARAKDYQGGTGIATVNISVSGTSSTCSGTGTIQREKWRNISGTELSSVPWDTEAGDYETYSSFETDQHVLDNYGSRMRGWVCVPITGNYTFWISSDDKSELYISTDDQAANKKLIASVTGYAPFRNYDKYPTQKSAPVSLVAGGKYYIEARHKEGTGNDFISVGWQLPNAVLERPIPGNRLIPYPSVANNKSPYVMITSPSNGQTFSAPANITIKADASDSDGSVQKVEFFVNFNKVGEDVTAPYSYQWNNVQAGSYTLWADAIDDRGARTRNGISVTVGGDQTCPGTGKIIREMWTNITGTSVSGIPVNSPPNKTSELTLFETPNYSGNDYGDRIRGYLCVPVTGSFKFYIASDDNSELWLSTDENPANKKKIAYLNSAVPPRAYNGVVSQVSQPVSLVGGKKYYIEALHKEGGGADHVSVAWQYQDGKFEGPIPGKYLIPYSSATTATAADLATIISDPEVKDEISLYPNPTSGREVTISISGNAIKEISETRVEVVSMNGKVVHAQSVNCNDNCENIVISLDNNVTSGVYVVNVLMNKKRLTKKLHVKQ